MQLNTPFFIGAQQFAHRLIQAPLAGISAAPFRALFSNYQAPAYAVTEMISAHSILQHKTLNPRYLAHSPKEGPWGIQLSGHEPGLMHEATQIAASYKPNLIDLNCGCPKPKIRAKGCGSALLDNPKQLALVVEAMRKATDLPLTVKIRTAGQTNDASYLEAATIIEASGADAIVVHGRHYSEDYDVAANYEQINQVVARVKIPVIANGDVLDSESLEACLTQSGASAVMIGRGSIGKPWLFQALLNQQMIEPDLPERLAQFKTHISELAVLEKSDMVALFQARRLLKWYFKHLDQEALKACYTSACLADLFQIIAT